MLRVFHPVYYGSFLRSFHVVVKIEFPKANDLNPWYHFGGKEVDIFGDRVKDTEGAIRKLRPLGGLLDIGTSRSEI